ncbi:MAG: hypothetical protein ABL993_06550 [Vicinamibacterales bacterium]
MPEIFDGGEATYADLCEAQFILGEIMRLYNEVNVAVLDGNNVLPADWFNPIEAARKPRTAAPPQTWEQRENTYAQTPGKTRE